MFNLSVSGAKGNFFDRSKVLAAMDRATRKALSKAGAFIRQRAKTSIRKRKKASAPGSPPSSHVGHLRKFLFFSYDDSSKSVVVGPARLSGTADPDAPNRLEYGGTVSGKGRVVFLTNQVGRNAAGRFTSGGKTRVEVSGMLDYPARPFMGPALEAERPGLPALWKDSVR